MHNAFEKKENKSFIVSVIMYNAEKFGRLYSLCEIWKICS
ncbi:MAG: hypothetical protein Ta2C_10370 [Candidatus Endomicrobiellum trichonymphae]|nr:MAG: hypothetical protein Ta2C_10370 [Candidatus Endomicrobium trichonymphae]